MGRMGIGTILATVALPALFAARGLAHPSSGIVVDENGVVFFQDIAGRAVWQIDSQGKLTKYFDKMGGHWMALDEAGRFSRVDFEAWFRQRTAPRFLRIAPSP